MIDRGAALRGGPLVVQVSGPPAPHGSESEAGAGTAEPPTPTDSPGVAFTCGGQPTAAVPATSPLHAPEPTPAATPIPLVPDDAETESCNAGASVGAVGGVLGGGGAGAGGGAVVVVVVAGNGDGLGAGTVVVTGGIDDGVGAVWARGGGGG
ncbi:MAG: hypothetical protein ACYDAD_14610, partial [Acidimicrobiales bacterium]